MRMTSVKLPQPLVWGHRCTYLYRGCSAFPRPELLGPASSALPCPEPPTNLCLLLAPGLVVSLC